MRKCGLQECGCSVDLCPQCGVWHDGCRLVAQAAGSEAVRAYEGYLQSNVTHLSSLLLGAMREVEVKVKGPRGADWTVAVPGIGAVTCATLALRE